MLLATLSLLLVQFPTEPSVAGRFNGTCLYPEVIRERAEGTQLVTCTQATVEQGAVVFGLQGWDVALRFEGTFEGDRLTVERIATDRGDVTEARGLCQLYFANDQLSTIACTAVAGADSYAANFIVARI